MTRRLRLSVGAAVVAVAFLLPAAAPSAGQDAAPRTPWGHPDLQGVWDFRTITPLERPAELADREFLTAEEAASLEQDVAARDARLLDRAPERTAAGGNVDRRDDGTPGFYNNFWLDTGTSTIGTRRTSLIVDPPNGRIPDLTASGERRAAEQREYQREHPADSWLDLDAGDRCLLGLNAGPPIVPAAYNQNLQVFQTPDHLMLLTEMVHTVRAVPLDGRPPLPEHIRQWSGDARGRWEGDTLVIETRNFVGKPPLDDLQPDGRARLQQEPDAGRAVDPRRRGHAGLHVHGDRPRVVAAPVDGVDPDAAERRSAVRVRLPRRQLQHAQHAGRSARGGAGGGRAAVICGHSPGDRRHARYRCEGFSSQAR